VLDEAQGARRLFLSECFRHRHIQPIKRLSAETGGCKARPHRRAVISGRRLCRNASLGTHPDTRVLASRSRRMLTTLLQAPSTQALQWYLCMSLICRTIAGRYADQVVRIGHRRDVRAWNIT